MAGSRRGRGEGSIYRRKDGRYVGQYEVSGGAGGSKMPKPGGGSVVGDAGLTLPNPSTYPVPFAGEFPASSGTAAVFL